MKRVTQIQWGFVFSMCGCGDADDTSEPMSGESSALGTSGSMTSSSETDNVGELPSQQTDTAEPNTGSDTASSSSSGTGGPPPPSGLLPQSDEFTNAEQSAAKWTFRHQVEEEDPQYYDFTFGSAEDARAVMSPSSGGWYGAFKGPFIFQEITGDFAMETHVNAHLTGDSSAPPTQAYNSAGLMVRATRSSSPSEQWVLHHLGMHDPGGTGVGVERKVTRNAVSELNTVNADFRGRIRICKVGSTILLTRQLDDESAFTESGRYDLAFDGPVQAGMSLTVWNSATATPDLSRDGDVTGVWDYVRYWQIDSLDRCFDDAP